MTYLLQKARREVEKYADWEGAFDYGGPQRTAPDTVLFAQALLAADEVIKGYRRIPPPDPQTREDLAKYRVLLEPKP